MVAVLRRTSVRNFGTYRRHLMSLPGGYRFRNATPPEHHVDSVSHPLGEDLDLVVELVDHVPSLPLVQGGGLLPGLASIHSLHEAELSGTESVTLGVCVLLVWVMAGHARTTPLHPG